MTSCKEHFYFTTIREPKIRVKSSIWFAQRSTESDGMVEYRPESDTTAKIIDYPATFKKVKTRWTRIVSCKYKDDLIVIINWYHRCGFVFDTKTREFRRNHFAFWSKAGIPTSCVAIGDYIHITSFTGMEINEVNSDYTICSMIDKSSKYFRGLRVVPSLEGSHVIKLDECYQSSNKILISGFIRIQSGDHIRNQSGDHIQSDIVRLISNFAIFEVFKFGGCNMNERKHVDSFYIGTLKDGDPTQPIEWKLAPQYTMKHRMVEFGYIQHGPVIVTFGGTIVNPDNTRTAIDSIFILDLGKDRGWIESTFKCPGKGKCNATLDDCGRVHLWFFDRETHFCIQLCDVLPLSS